jgi:hypothetical protein
MYDTVVRKLARVEVERDIVTSCNFRVSGVNPAQLGQNNSNNKATITNFCDPNVARGYQSRYHSFMTKDDHHVFPVEVC